LLPERAVQPAKRRTRLAEQKVALGVNGLRLMSRLGRNTLAMFDLYALACGIQMRIDEESHLER
jgi:hypothetical protein